MMVDRSGVLQKFNGNDNVFLSFLPLSPFYNLPRNTILQLHTTGQLKYSTKII